MIFAYLLFVLIIVVSFHKWWSHSNISHTEPPLVSGWIPYLGVALEYGHNPKKFLENTRKTNGNVFSIFIAGNILTVNLEPTFIKQFYRYPEETLDFYNGLRTVRLDEALGPTFHPKRAMFMMQILQNKFIPMFPSFIAPFISEIDYIIQNTKYLSSPEGNVDTWKMFDRLVIGLSLKSIVSTHARHEELCECVMELEKLAQKLLQRPGITGNSIVKQCELIRKRIYEILQPETERRRELMKADPNSLPQDVLTIALQSCDDWEVVRDAPVGVLFGAVANTNAVATLALWHICRDQALLEAVRKEVVQVMMDCQGVLNEEILNKLELLEACSMEVTRLYAISLSVRKVGTGLHMNGYQVPEGRYVAISSLLGMRNPDIFPNPDTYNPYRFIKGSKSYSAEQTYQFTGFGGGRHICKGMKLAKMELRILLATLIHRYEFSISENSPEIPGLEWISLGVAFPKASVMMKYKKRDTGAGTERPYLSPIPAGFSPVSK